MLNTFALKVLDHGKESASTIYLLTKDSEPLKLGEGKFAKVFLGSRRPVDETPLGLGDLIAIKFLKRNTSATVTSNSIYRFCKEIDRTALATSAALNSLVRFLGYGRIGLLPSLGTREAELMWEGFALERGSQIRNHRVFGTRTHEQIDEIFRGNEPGPLARNFHELFTGDFYSLELCLMSLEELLLTRGDPFSQSSGEALAKCGIESAPILQDRARDAEFLGARGIKLSSTSDGFRDLDDLKRHIEAHRDDQPSGLGQRFRSAVLLRLALMCLDTITQLHEAVSHDNSAPGGNGKDQREFGFAHRDLKPANILLSVNAVSRLMLSDLGFVASVGEIRVTNHTILSSIDEGGVLPSGSKGFRSPEQIESGEEFSFSACDASKKKLAVFSYFDTRIEAGDFLKIDAKFSDKTNVTRIVATEDDNEENRRVILPVALDSDEKLQKGRLIKDVSLHSDIYSVGCIAYYLGSEGRNPERFMRYFVDEVARQSLRAALPTWVLESPLWMAAVLCTGDASVVLADVKRIAEKNYKPRVASSEDHASHIEQLTIALNGSIKRWLPANEYALQISRYREGMAGSPNLLELFSGRVTREPISFPQLYLIFLCCLRDRDDSIVRREQALMEPEGRCLAVYSTNARNFSREVKERIVGLLAGASCRGDWKLAELGTTEAEIFMRARLARRI